MIPFNVIYFILLFLCSTSAVDTVYNPGKNNYHPIDDAFWNHKEKVPYLALAKTLELIENTSGRYGLSNEGFYIFYFTSIQTNFNLNENKPK